MYALMTLLAAGRCFVWRSGWRIQGRGRAAQGGNGRVGGDAGVADADAQHGALLFPAALNAGVAGAFWVQRASAKTAGVGGTLGDKGVRPALAGGAGCSAAIVATVGACLLGAGADRLP